MTAADLHELFVTTLLREAGNNRRHWRLALGDIRVYNITTHPHCNWTVAPAGTLRDVHEIERIADRLRERYPIIRAQ